MTSRGLAGRAVVLERVTIGYNVVEAVIAVTFGIIAGSIALTGFGFDSWIEVVAAAVVLRRLRAEIAGGQPDEAKERAALRLVAVTFFVLATYVVVEGIRNLVVGSRPSTSLVGIVLTGLSVVVMPTLARLKRAAGEAMGSRLVMADAAETKLCAWLSASTLAGLASFAIFEWSWIDPVAGFVIAYFAVREGREAWAGELARDEDDEDIGGTGGSRSAAPNEKAPARRPTDSPSRSKARPPSPASRRGRPRPSPWPRPGR